MIPALTVNSKICLTPSQCYNIATELPPWIYLVLIGSAYLIIKDIYKILT